MGTLGILCLTWFIFESSVLRPTQKALKGVKPPFIFSFYWRSWSSLLFDLPKQQKLAWLKEIHSRWLIPSVFFKVIEGKCETKRSCCQGSANVKSVQDKNKSFSEIFLVNFSCFCQSETLSRLVDSAWIGEYEEICKGSHWSPICIQICFEHKLLTKSCSLMLFSPWTVTLLGYIY